MKSVIQEVSRDVVTPHRIVLLTRDEKVWGPLYEPLIMIDTVRNAVRNPIRVRSVEENDSDS